jgi:DNA-binding response OmpR family regulator
MGQAKPRVLYAEDETLIASMVEEFLTEAGFETIVAHDGEQAARMLARHRDKLAAFVIDVQLGRGPNGWDLARRARASNPRLPIVYTTGDSAYQWPTEGVPHSLAIAKPFVESQLLDALSGLMNAPIPATEGRAPPELRQDASGSPANVDELRATIDKLTNKIAEFEAAHGEGASEGELPKEKLATIAMSIYRARRRRSKFFEASLFAEPAWDMLLDLFVASVRGRKVSLTSLCWAAEVSEATGLRWIETLESKGLVRRRSVSEDGDLKCVEISDDGFEAMCSYVLDGVRKFEMPMPG